MTEAIASVLVVLGAVLALLAAIGLQRFPDVLSRMHAATKPATLGMLLVLISLAIRDGRLGVIAKVALVAALQFLTAPTGAHMVGRATFEHGARAVDRPAPSDPPADPDGITAPR